MEDHGVRTSAREKRVADWASERKEAAHVKRRPGRVALASATLPLRLRAVGDHGRPAGLALRSPFPGFI
jgi:hypothetical protein